MDKQFNTRFPLTQEGWIDYPVKKDQALRKSLFPEGVMAHPAKMNVFLEQDIINYVSKQGDIIMDIMSGTGTIFIAAAMGRPTVAIEIQDGWHHFLLEAKEMFEARGCSPITVLHGDCRYFLPLPCNHIIFSPPYSEMMKSKQVNKAESTRYLHGSLGKTQARHDEGLLEYSSKQRNIGNLNDYLFHKQMAKIYQQCWDSIKAGGTFTVIIQDRTKDGERIGLTPRMIKDCNKVGFTEILHECRYSRGTGFKKSWKSKGIEVVDNEDIVIFRRR